MNRFLISIASLALAAPSHAQWAVYDAALHKQQVLSSTQEISKFVEMIGNQVDQLKVLQEEVTTLQHYVGLFGTPGKVQIPSASELTQVLQRSEVGQGMVQILAAADPVAAMSDQGRGLFTAIGTTFLTPQGQEIARSPQLYRSIAAIQETTENFIAVAADAATRRTTIKAEIAKTTAALSKAQTDAEVQKLGAVLVGLGSALQSTDLEVAQATASVLVQDAANRADERRQTEARKERQSAEFTEAIRNYGTTFRLLTGPTPFPTP